MKLSCFFCVVLFLFFTFNNLFAQSRSEITLPLSGKDLFYNSNGKYGSCNHCHLNGLSSAGRWNFETEQIDKEEGRKIPVLKGIGKRKSQEQIERSVQLMRKLFGFKLTDEQISQLAEYLGTL